MDQLTLK